MAILNYPKKALLADEAVKMRFLPSEKYQIKSMEAAIFSTFLNIVMVTCIFWFFIKESYPIVIGYETIDFVPWGAVIFLSIVTFTIHGRVMLTYAFTSKWVLIGLISNIFSFLVFSVIFMSLAGKSLGNPLLTIATVMVVSSFPLAIFLHLRILKRRMISSVITAITILIIECYPLVIYDDISLTIPLIITASITSVLIIIIALYYDRSEIIRKISRYLPLCFSLITVLFSIYFISLFYILCHVSTQSFFLTVYSSIIYVVLMILNGILILIIVRREFNSILVLYKIFGSSLLLTSHFLFSLQIFHIEFFLFILLVRIYSFLGFVLGVIWILSGFMIPILLQMVNDFEAIRVLLRDTAKKGIKEQLKFLKNRFRFFEYPPRLDFGFHHFMKKVTIYLAKKSR